jgi:hypothetical protein
MGKSVSLRFMLSTINPIANKQVQPPELKYQKLSGCEIQNTCPVSGT